jgi:hypothetical protein
MATITPSTTYTDGVLLNIAGHNANIFSTTSGKGVLSEPNGGLEQANLDPGSLSPFREPFRIYDESVMSEEAVFARQDGLVVPMDLFSDAFGDAGQTEDAFREKSFITIAGLAQRTYFPYAAAAVIWQWSFFAALYRPVVVGDGSSSSPGIFVRAYLDGQPLASFTRPLVTSARLSEVGFGANYMRDNEDIEDFTAMWYDFSKLSTNVSAGYHELSIKVYMERAELRASIYADGVFPDADSPDDSFLFDVLSRVTFGVRNARCVSFK